MAEKVERDPDRLFEDLERQLLKSCRPAVRRLARAARKKSDFKNELELRACLGLARIVADLLYGRQNPSRPSAFDSQVSRLMKGGL